MKNGRIQIHTAEMENKLANRAKLSNKRCIKARLQYLQRGYKASETTSRAPCFPLLSRFSWLTCLILFRFFCPNNKINLSLANANNSASFERKMV